MLTEEAAPSVRRHAALVGGWLAASPPPAAWTDDALEGWRTYVETRLSPDSSGTIRIEPPMLDGLS